ncbi:hypothetical protein FOZ62_008117, partial [Perkinsus olseni]
MSNAFDIMMGRSASSSSASAGSAVAPASYGPRESSRDDEPESDGNKPGLPEAESPRPTKKRKKAPVKERHPWIEEIEEADGQSRYFCTKEYFTNTGVDKKKDPGRKAAAHEAKPSHQAAVARDATARGPTQSVVKKMHDAALKAFQKNSAGDAENIKNYIKLALWLTAREIPHTTNYEPLIELVSSFNATMLHWGQVRPQNAHYRSAFTCTEFISICSDVCDSRTSSKLLEGIKRFNRWALMIDESSLYGQSIMGVFARFLTGGAGIDQADVVEELLVCCPIESTKAAVLEERLVHELQSRGIDDGMWQMLGALSCDGASAMSSAQLGLFGRLKTRFGLETLQFQHCRSHRVNLVAKSVLSSGDFPRLEETIALSQDLFTYLSKSNKKTELFKEISKADGDDDVEGTKAPGKFLKLVEAGGTRWLSHNNSLERLIRVYVRVVKLLFRVSEASNFVMSERTRAEYLLERMLSKETISCLTVLSKVLSELALFTKAFQSQAWTLDRAIDLTTEVIQRLELMAQSDSPLGDNEQAVNLVKSLEQADFEVVDQPRRLRSCRGRGSLEENMKCYIKALATEMRRRFNDDTKLVAYLEIFTHPAWIPRIPTIAAKFGFDKEQLLFEARSIKKHIEMTEPLRRAASAPQTMEQKRNYKKNFWLSFCSDSYSRTLYPEHSRVAAFLLTSPITSSS